MKKILSKTLAWLKTLAVSVWESADYVEVPSSSAWGDFKRFKEVQHSPVAEIAEALVTIPLVLVASWVRLLVPTVYGVLALAFLAGGLVWKLIPPYSKS